MIKEDLEPFRWEPLSVELRSTIQRHICIYIYINILSKYDFCWSFLLLDAALLAASEGALREALHVDAAAHRHGAEHRVQTRLENIGEISKSAKHEEFLLDLLDLNMLNSLQSYMTYIYMYVCMSYIYIYIYDPCTTEPWKTKPNTSALTLNANHRITESPEQIPNSPQI